MEQVRDRRLEGYCEGIADARDRKNTAVADEKGYEQGALKHMQQKGTHAFKWAGIALTLIPGADKLSVRVLKDTESTDTGEGSDEAQGDLGEAADEGGGEGDEQTGE